jgi:hypothetical protein
MCVNFRSDVEKGQGRAGGGAFDHAGWELMGNMYLLLLLSILLLFWIEIVLMGAKSRSKEV